MNLSWITPEFVALVAIIFAISGVSRAGYKIQNSLCALIDELKKHRGH